MTSEIEIVGHKETGQRELTVTVAGPRRPDLTGGDARSLAIAEATRHLGRCGFSKVGNWSYRNPPDLEHPTGKILSEQDLITPGVLRPGGLYLQELIIQAGA